MDSIWITQKGCKGYVCVNTYLQHSVAEMLYIIAKLVRSKDKQMPGVLNSRLPFWISKMAPSKLKKKEEEKNIFSFFSSYNAREATGRRSENIFVCFF